MMKYYTMEACSNLIDKYINEYKGEATNVCPGVLGLGKVVLHGAPHKKTIIITEVFLNEWSSGHTVRAYNKIPKKYEQLINN